MTEGPTPVPEVLDRDRLDRALKALRPHLSWSHVRRLVTGGRVRVAGRIVTDPASKVNAGDVLLVDREAEAPRRPGGGRPEIAVLHEDAAIVALDKPPDLSTTPASQKGEPDLLSMARRRLGRIYMVHRLDRGTSGVVLFARTRSAQLGLLSLFRNGAVEKEYVAVVARAPEPPSGTIRSLLGRPGAGRRASVERGGRTAITAYRTRAASPGRAVVELRPQTGRTHQLRIHMAERGSPILGDRVYGTEASSAAAPRLMLHAARIAFVAPWSGQRIEISSPVPRSFDASPAASDRGPRRPRPRS
ncbi:MAG: RluA family pseudouridine synthase [Acidobacteriota bacterium]